MPKLIDFWDTRTDAIRRNSASLARMPRHDKEVRLREMASTITDAVNALDDVDAAISTFVVAEDLYKTIASYTVEPDEGTFEYLRATAGTLFTCLEARGVCLRYIIDNDYETRLGGPINLFPFWFRDSGLFYISPQRVAVEMMKKLPDFDPTKVVGRLPDFYEDGWAISLDLVQRCERDGRPYVFLNANTSDRWDELVAGRHALPPNPDILPVIIFREQAPDLGSKAVVLFPEHLRGQIAEKQGLG